ncbi:MAG TPA: FAD:protein FMN transferase [Helicobacteraceae bacterium]|nr:FAD:protein FMN transferase [Helicobacteraceae bacterium]
MFYKKSVFLLAVVVPLYVMASSHIRRTQMMMGTYVTIEVEASKVASIGSGFERMKMVEMALSSYDPSAQIYQLNLHKKTSISKDTYEALTRSQSYYQKSKGAFDISIGSITRDLYRFGEDAVIPTDEALDRATVNFKGIHFTKNEAWLEPGVRVDLGGMGKGFGVDEVAKVLQDEGVKEAKIMASGDIKCFQMCSIAIKNPFKAGTIAQFTTRYPLSAISTSGNYERYVKNKSHHHLIDPKVKRSARTFAGITLVSRGDNADIDAYATAASVMSYDAAVAFLETCNVWYFLIEVDGSITYKLPNDFVDDLVIFKT